MQPISDIKSIKLYYPFLRDRQTSLKEQHRDILSYLLLTDNLILPPDHIFNENVARKNADFIEKNDTLKQFFKRGLIITTSTDSDIRDYKDLIEERANISNIRIKDFSIPLYFRDSKSQIKIYTDFFLKEFSVIKNDFYEKDKVKQLLGFLKSHQGHHNLIQQIHKLKFSGDDKPLADYTKNLAKIAYLKGGADGNYAIMPSLDSTNEYTFFNDYYSLRFVQQFAFRVSKQLRCDIVDLKFDKFLRLVETLKAFKDEYFAKSNLFKNIDDDVYKVLCAINTKDRYRKYKTGVNFLVGFTIGEIISDLILPTLHLEASENYILKFIIAVIFEKYRVLENVLSIANQTVDTKDFETYLTTQFGSVMDKFDNTIKLI